MIGALPRLHGQHQGLTPGSMVVRHMVPSAPTRIRTRLQHMALAFGLAIGATALLLTVAMFAMASRTPSTDHSHPTASAQAAPRPPAFG